MKEGDGRRRSRGETEREEEKATWNCKRKREERENVDPDRGCHMEGELPITRQDRKSMMIEKTSRTLCMGVAAVCELGS